MHVRLRLRSMVLLALAVAVTAVSLVPVTAASGGPKGKGGPKPSPTPTPVPTATPAPTGTFALAGVHPQAAVQSTEQGQTLVALEPFGGALYAGYGDYGANTGPIAVSPFDPVSSAFSLLHRSDTEAIFGYRNLGGRLYAPAIDRRSAADFTEGTPWADRRPVSSAHAFDMATLTGSDRWLVGAAGYSALAWRSLDGGATWSQALALPAQSGIQGDFARFYFVGVYGGKLYVQGVDYYGGPQAASRVFDGQTWSTGPNLLPLGGLGWHPVGFAGRMVYLTRGAAHGVSRVMVFDGASAASPVSWYAYDVAVGGSALYALGSDGRVYRTTDLASWTAIGTAPTGSRSIAVLDGSLYVGATDARLFRFSALVG